MFQPERTSTRSPRRSTFSPACSALSARGRVSVGVLVGLGLALDLAAAGFVSASTFTINPIQVFLTDAAKSTVVTLHNTSAETLRFQLSVFAWGQSPAGEMLLTPTADIVFFPKLLTLGPREERKSASARRRRPG